MKECDIVVFSKEGRRQFFHNVDREGMLIRFYGHNLAIVKWKHRKTLDRLHIDFLEVKESQQPILITTEQIKQLINSDEFYNSYIQLIERFLLMRH